MSNGEVSVLNVRAGDLRFSFSSDDPIEVERARRVVEDMLRRGYALFIAVDGQLRKVQRFDPSTDTYIIANGPLYAGDREAAEAPTAETPAEPKPRRGRPPTRSVPARSTRATGVAPTAGG